MSSMVIWMLGIGVSVAALVVTAAIKWPFVHMAVAALVSILMALSAYQETRAGVAGKVSQGELASTNMRHMGLVFAWGALAIFVTYAFAILQWREWLHFFVAFLVLAGLSLFLSATLRKDSDAKDDDETMLTVAWVFAIVVLVAMLVTMAGLLLDGKMWRFSVPAGQRPGSQDWAANNIFFFGALSLAAIAWNAISQMRSGKA